MFEKFNAKVSCLFYKLTMADLDNLDWYFGISVKILRYRR